MNQAQSPDSAPFKPEFIHMHHYLLDKDADGEWFLRSDTVGRTDDEITKIPVDLFQGIDPASSLSDTADFFVIATLAVDAENNVYIVDILKDKIAPSKQPRTIIERFKRFSPRRVKIETVAYQEALRDNVRALMREEGLYIPGLEKGVKPRNSKSERLLSLVPMFARKKFFFRSQDMDVQSEFLSYPKGKHDDQMDAIWTALQGATPCRRKNVNAKSTKNKKVKVYDWRVL
jgi:predicted phage terminase large subunit-like protein